MALRTPSRRDVVLLLMGALCVHFFATWLPLAASPSIAIGRNVAGHAILQQSLQDVQEMDVFVESGIHAGELHELGITDLSPKDTSAAQTQAIGLAETTVVEHVPGWTVFRDIYMANGTLFIVSSSPTSFPDIRYMISTGLPGYHYNIQEREPTQSNMDILTPEQAAQRWDVGHSRARISSIEGNTLLFNDPPQFLQHYYHFCAELLLGAWSFWTGAAHPNPPPPIHRAIFSHSSAQGWRDGPGFNGYFLRAAFPSLTVEIDVDWEDRVNATSSTGVGRAWHFPYLLLADRSAAFRGRFCGSQTQRTASESINGLVARSKLDPDGVWWRPVRNSVWRFAGVDVPQGKSTIARVGNGEDGRFEETDKVVITYISRQGARRHLVPEDHDRLVKELEDLVARKNAEVASAREGDSIKRKEWVLNMVQAEEMTKDEQVRLAAQTNILLGVHGNGLSHLILMPHTRSSAVIEIFYPGGFAHDYEWTAKALGLRHFAIWNDTYYTEETTPPVHYPEGFQGTSIPVHGPNIANLIEQRIVQDLF